MTADFESSPDADLRAAVAWALEELAAVKFPTEVLAQLHPARRRFLIRKNPTFEALGEVWRLGPLLIATTGEVFAHGRTIRAAKRERLGIQSESQEARRDLAGFAFDSGFAEGSEVNFDAVFIPLTRAQLVWPLTAVGSEVRVLWRRGADASSSPEFGSFLRDRVMLMKEPPGASGSW